MFANLAYLKALADAIRGLYGTTVLHVQTATVHPTDHAPWKGNVEVFALIGTSEAQRCFAWPNSNGEAVVLLATPQISTPEDAVRTYYAAHVANTGRA